MADFKNASSLPMLCTSGSGKTGQETGSTFWNSGETTIAELSGAISLRLTKGFRTFKTRSRHFQAHGPDFASSAQSGYDALQYEADADYFLGAAICQNTHPASVSCVRLRDGDVIRYDLNTHEFGVLASDGYIRTYYIPDILVHGFADHYEYFFYESQKR